MININSPILKEAAVDKDELVLKIKISDFLTEDTIEENVERRMYCLVLRQLSPIQKGIQSAHAIVEYANEYSSSKMYIDWSRRDKTIVMLDGGVVNDLENIVDEFKENNVCYSVFNEPDLGGIITAISVIVDDYVYDKDKYPDFVVWRDTKYPDRKMYFMDSNCTVKSFDNDITYTEHYEEWTNNVMGGKRNVFLRNFLSNKRLSQ